MIDIIMQYVQWTLIELYLSFCFYYYLLLFTITFKYIIGEPGAQEVDKDSFLKCFQLPGMMVLLQLFLKQIICCIQANMFVWFVLYNSLNKLFFVYKQTCWVCFVQLFKQLFFVYKQTCWVCTNPHNMYKTYPHIDKHNQHT